MSLFRKHSLFDKAVEYLSAHRYEFSVLAPATVISAEVPAGDVRTRQRILVNNEAGTINIFGIVDLVVPENKRPHVAELVLRLNQQVIVGNWHLDYDNGFVVFCTRLAAPDGGVTGAMLRAVHLNNVAFVAKQVSAFN